MLLGITNMIVFSELSSLNTNSHINQKYSDIAGIVLVCQEFVKKQRRYQSK